jgi:hypothetical protein
MESKLKHLEFIQAAINRMAQNSFVFKGWAVTVAAGLSAFGAVDTKYGLLAIALVSTLMFWGLDAYYLWLERCFITLYGEVAAKTDDQIDFSMSINKVDGVTKWLKTCTRPHLLLLYGALILIEVIAIFVIKGVDGG